MAAGFDLNQFLSPVRESGTRWIQGLGTIPTPGNLNEAWQRAVQALQSELAKRPRRSSGLVEEQQRVMRARWGQRTTMRWPPAGQAILQRGMAIRAAVSLSGRVPTWRLLRLLLQSIEDLIYPRNNAIACAFLPNSIWMRYPRPITS